MQASARENYLSTAVLTATPQELQLMLIQAALGAAQQARQKWEGHGDDGPGGPLVRAQEVVGQLLAGLNPDAGPTLAKQVASVYLFVYRSLIEAAQSHSTERLDDAIRLLTIERETWRQVCAKLGAGEKTGTPNSSGRHAAGSVHCQSGPIESRLSLEA